MPPIKNTNCVIIYIYVHEWDSRDYPGKLDSYVEDVGELSGDKQQQSTTNKVGTMCTMVWDAQYRCQWPLLLTWFNPLRAKFFRGDINIYLHFMSFLHIDLTQVLQILPQVSKAPTYSI